MRELLAAGVPHMLACAKFSVSPDLHRRRTPPPIHTGGPRRETSVGSGGRTWHRRAYVGPLPRGSRISHFISGRWCSKGTEAPSGVRESRRFEQEQRVLSLEPPRLPQGAGSNVPNFGWVRSACTRRSRFPSLSSGFILWYKFQKWLDPFTPIASCCRDS